MSEIFFKIVDEWQAEKEKNLQDFLSKKSQRDEENLRTTLGFKTFSICESKISKKEVKNNLFKVAQYGNRRTFGETRTLYPILSGNIVKMIISITKIPNIQGAREFINITKPIRRRILPTLDMIATMYLHYAGVATRKAGRF